MIIAAVAIAYGAITLIPGPAQIVSKSLDHYYRAGTLSGTIATTITAGSHVETCTTKIQVSSPNRMYFEQTWPKSKNHSFKTVANGDYYVYPDPSTVGEGAQKRKYLVEPMEQRDTIYIDYKGIYGVIGVMVADRSIPLDIIFGRDADLQTVNSLLSNYQDGGVRQYEGESVNVVFCDVKHSAVSEFKMKGAFFINDAGDIRYFKVFGNIYDANENPVSFASEWVVKVKVNDKDSIDPKLYNLDLVNGQ